MSRPVIASLVVNDISQMAGIGSRILNQESNTPVDVWCLHGINNYAGGDNFHLGHNPAGITGVLSLALSNVFPYSYIPYGQVTRRTSCPECGPTLIFDAYSTVAIYSKWPITPRGFYYKNEDVYECGEDGCTPYDGGMQAIAVTINFNNTTIGIASAYSTRNVFPGGVVTAAEMTAVAAWVRTTLFAVSFYNYLTFAPFIVRQNVQTPPVVDPAIQYTNMRDNVNNGYYPVAPFFAQNPRYLIDTWNASGTQDDYPTSGHSPYTDNYIWRFPNLLAGSQSTSPLTTFGTTYAVRYPLIMM